MNPGKDWCEMSIIVADGRGFAVINIDIISYLVVKNVILRFRPCWVYPVG